LKTIGKRNKCLNNVGSVSESVQGWVFGRCADLLTDIIMFSLWALSKTKILSSLLCNFTSLFPDASPTTGYCSSDAN
jgi:hypothetical protein